MRYVGEISWRFTGETRRYTAAARTKLGVWMATLGDGVETARSFAQLAAGVYADMRLVGGRPYIHIAAVNVNTIKAQSLKGVVVTPRNTAYPDGQHPTYPEAILAPLVTSDEKLWAAAWADATANGFASTPSPKGAYIAALPDGVGAGGNIDWRGPSGERLSWYGPASRYWYDPTEPGTLPKQWLFHSGKVFLDAADYAAEAAEPDIAGGIMGAAFWRDADGGTWLHVIHLDGSTHRLVRYSVGGTGVDRFVGTFEIIETHTLTDSKSPWFFSEDGSKAVHMTDPDNGFFFDASAPSECVLSRLTVLEDGTASFSDSTSSITVGSFETPSQAVFAADFVGNAETFCYVQSRDVYDRIAADTLPTLFVSVYAWGDDIGADAGGELLTTERQVIDYIAGLSGVTTQFNQFCYRRLIHADLRSGSATFLFYMSAATGGSSIRASTYHIEAYQGGARVLLQHVLTSMDYEAGSYLAGLMPRQIAFGTAPSYSPRMLAYSAWNVVPTANVFIRGWLASAASWHSESPWRNSAAAAPYGWYTRGGAETTRVYGYEDARGHLHYGVWFTEGVHSLASFYTPVLRKAETVDFVVVSHDTSQAVNWMTFGELPARLATTGDPVFYPGYPLGLTASTQ